jgi:hypothetical protein
MGTERIPCRTEGCANTILPATANANDGFCMPCVHKRHEKEREEFIRKHHREEDPYAGITDPVELLRIFHTPRPHNPLVTFRPPPKSPEELYASLNSSQNGRLMTIAADAFRSCQDHFAQSLGRSLALFTDFPLDPMLEAWIDRNLYWPPILFRGAGASIRNAVVVALESGRANANHALSALAWIGDDRVAGLFREWKSRPQSWASGLHVGPADYAHDAGWELGPTGRRDLFHHECWAIETNAAGADADSSVTFMREVDQTCPWCKRRLVHLVEIDLGNQRFAFLGISGAKLPVLTCDACTCYGQSMYSRISPDGTARLLDENPPKWLPTDLNSWSRSPWKDQAIRLYKRRAIRAADWFTDSISQIGGLPSWVQDTEFPKCPECSRTMKFVAQVDNGQFPGREGIYYAFLCASCRITATTYQQS